MTLVEPPLRLFSSFRDAGLPRTPRDMSLGPYGRFTKNAGDPDELIAEFGGETPVNRRLHQTLQPAARRWHAALSAAANAKLWTIITRKAGALRGGLPLDAARFAELACLVVGAAEARRRTMIDGEEASWTVALRLLPEVTAWIPQRGKADVLIEVGPRLAAWPSRNAAWLAGLDGLSMEFDPHPISAHKRAAWRSALGAPERPEISR